MLAEKCINTRLTVLAVIAMLGITTADANASGAFEQQPSTGVSIEAPLTNQYPDNMDMPRFYENPATLEGALPESGNSFQHTLEVVPPKMMDVPSLQLTFYNDQPLAIVGHIG